MGSSIEFQGSKKRREFHDRLTLTAVIQQDSRTPFNAVSFAYVYMGVSSLLLLLLLLLLLVLFFDIQVAQSQLTG
jgi:hypothetical protein